MFQFEFERKGEEIIRRKVESYGEKEGEGKRGDIGRCQSIAIKRVITSLSKKLEDEVDEPETTIEELVEVSLDENDPNKKVLVGTLLAKKEKDELMLFLQKNKEIFAWSHRDIPRVDPSMAENQLNIDPRYPLVHQKKRRFSLEQNKIISDEIDRLLETNAMNLVNIPIGCRM